MGRSDHFFVSVFECNYKEFTTHLPATSTATTSTAAVCRLLFVVLYL